MSQLLLYISETELFDPAATQRAIESIDGVSKARAGDFIGAVFECLYTFGDRSTVVRLTKKLRTVAIEGLGDEAFDFALKFQKNMPMPLHAIDMEYTFDVVLTQFNSLDELLEAVSDD